MDCRDFKEMLDSYFCQELAVETNHAILCHAEHCPPCRNEMASRRSMREALQRACAQDQMSDEACERLRALLAVLGAIALAGGLYGAWAAAHGGTHATVGIRPIRHSLRRLVFCSSMWPLPPLKVLTGRYAVHMPPDRPRGHPPLAGVASAKPPCWRARIVMFYLGPLADLT